MGLADFNFKITDEIKTTIDKLNIGLNKEEKKLVIEALDNSTNVHIHNEVGLSDETILKLSTEQAGNFLRQRALLNLQAACNDNPEKMNQYFTMYTATAITTGTSIVTAASPELSPMPSGDFIQKLPTAIENIKFISVSDNLKISDKIEVEIIKKRDNSNQT